jgi:chemotaxis protein MotA
LPCEEEKYMNISSIGFLIFGFVMMIGSFVIEGGTLGSLLAPTAAMIVFGGTLAAVGLAFPMKDFKRLPGAAGKVFKGKEKDLGEMILFFKSLSIKARKNGLLSIETEINAEGIDPFVKKGLQLVVDGVDPQTIEGILELEAEATSERHKKASAMFESAGGFSPTMGIIGTVMGLVHVLGNLSDPSSLGPKIAVAFIATLYGVSFANLVYLPMGSKLKILDEYENNERMLVIEAVLLIQTGTNPTTLVEKLKGLLNNKDRLKLDAAEKEVA